MNKTEIYFENEFSDEQKNTERWKLALESEGVGVWDYDFQSHQVFYSKRYKEMYCLTEDEDGNLSHNWTEVIHPDDKDWVIAQVKKYLAGEIFDFSLEYRMLCADGSIKWILDRAMMVNRTEDGKPLRMIGTHADITQRKVLEIERQQYFNLFNLSVDLLCIAWSDCSIKQINPAFVHLLGYSKEELLRTSFVNYIIPEDRELTLEHISQLLTNKQVLAFENHYCCKDNSVRCLSWRAYFNEEDGLIYSTARDVTEEKKNEKKLQLAQTVYQHSMEGILVTDANNEIVAVNPAFCKITGYKEAEVLGKNPRIFKSNRQPPEFYQAMWNSLNTQGYWQGEIWDKRKNGQEHAKFLTINKILNPVGKVDGYIGLFSDITAKKQYEERIKQLNDSELYKAKLEAEKASKAKSEFLASMSHELFTPMNAVLGFAQVLESDDNLTAEQHSYISEILVGGYHLLNLIRDVLDFSALQEKKISLDLKTIDLTTLVEHCVILMLKLATDKGIVIINHLTQAGGISVFADGLRLKQILLNLLSNAIKYNKQNGNIIIAYELIDDTKKVKLSVIDTGEGISEEQIIKLFNPFERLCLKDSAVEGAGLGLCICKKLIDSMKGSIGITSKIGEGSSVWIEIPLL